jgi:prepilin-type N-terminal cleavage/methylation domain
MLGRQHGFSLAEVLVALALGSILLLSVSRFLPTLQAAVLRQTQGLALEDELWQHALAVAKHLQRAGYCRGVCRGQPLILGRKGSCVLVQWDANGNGRWDPASSSMPEQIGFRLQGAALETLRGAASCEGKGWERMTEPATVQVQAFQVERQQRPGFAPQLTVTLSAVLTDNPRQSATVQHSVTGYNL